MRKNKNLLGTARYLKDSMLYSGKKGFLDVDRSKNSDFKQGPSLLLKDLTATQVVEYRNEDSAEQSKNTQREEVHILFLFGSLRNSDFCEIRKMKMILIQNF